MLFARYKLSDVAFKVVGVGSVGNNAAVALLEDADHELLMLQMKQAKPSVLAPFIPKSMQLSNQGARDARPIANASRERYFLGLWSFNQAIAEGLIEVADTSVL